METFTAFTAADPDPQIFLWNHVHLRYTQQQQGEPQYPLSQNTNPISKVRWDSAATAKLAAAFPATTFPDISHPRTSTTFATVSDAHQQPLLEYCTPKPAATEAIQM